MTTDFDNNSYVKDGVLYIVPTLTSEVIGVANVFDAFSYNVSGCTNTVDFNGGKYTYLHLVLIYRLFRRLRRY